MTSTLFHYKQLELDALLEITQAINLNKSTAELYKIYGFTLRAHMGVTRMAVVYFDDPHWEIAFSEGLTEKEFISLNEMDEWCAFESQLEYLHDSKLEIAEYFDLLLPVRHKDRCVAFVLIANFDHIVERNVPVSVDEKIKFIQTITNIIIVAIENKRLFKKDIEKQSIQKEMELARKVQKMLIPGKLPKSSELDIAAIYRPHHSIGGDYYDMIKVSENEFIFCMADVSGKGVAAALLMANFQALLRVLARETKSLTDLIKNLNSRVEEITQGEQFITVFLGRYNTSTLQLDYINAGHPPPLLYHQKSIIELVDGCLILGAFRELIKIEVGHVTLSKNSLLLIYTDGLTELSNAEGELFDETRLKDFMTDYNALDPEAFLDKLIARMNQFRLSKNFNDDVSVMCWRVDATSS